MPKTYIIRYNTSNAANPINAEGSKTNFTISPSIHGFFKKGRVMLKNASIVYTSTGSVVSEARTVNNLTILTSIPFVNVYNAASTFSDRILFSGNIARTVSYPLSALGEVTAQTPAETLYNVYILGSSNAHTDDFIDGEIANYHMNTPINIKLCGDDGVTPLTSSLITRVILTLVFIDDSDDIDFRQDIKYMKAYIINERSKGQEIIDRI